MNQAENITANLKGAENAQWEITRYGVYIYIDEDPDWASPDILIDPNDTKGIEIFREFAAKMAAHYKTLKNKS